jgi:hypothetical protein
VVFAVWLPMIPTDGVSVPASSTALIRDPRVTHLWDAPGRLGSLFGPVIGLPRGKKAWDAYLLYAPGVRWSGRTPPTPSFWMHQLRELPGDLCLDAPRLARELEALLSRSKTAAGEGQAAEAARARSSPLTLQGCSLKPSELATRRKSFADLFGQAQEVEELPDGVRIVFPGRPGLARALARLVLAERACCPRVRIVIEDRVRQDPLVVSIRGDAEVGRSIAGRLRDLAISVTSPSRDRARR